MLAVWLHIGVAVLVVVAAIFVGFPVVLVIVGLLEKRPRKPFVAPAAGEQLALSPYHQCMNELVARRGFEFQGTYKHVKGGTYRLVVSMWFSPDRDILVLVGGGSIAKLRYRQTNLYSRMADGSYLTTGDEFGVTDISGILHRSCLLNADFDELLQHHLVRIDEADTLPVPFPQATALEAFEEKEAVEAARLESLGWLRYIDPAQATWRYSLSGAVRMGLNASVLKNQKEIRKQAPRSNRPRPGDSDYQPATVPTARPVARITQPASARTATPAFNCSFEGAPVRFQADSPDLLVFDPSALDALHEALSEMAFPLGGVTPAFMNDLNSRFSVGHCRIEGFRPGMYELSPQDIRPCSGQPAPDDFTVFAVNTGAVVLADYHHVLRLGYLLNWDSYEMARQSPARRSAVFASVSNGLGGPFYAVLKLAADEGFFRLDPRSIRSVA